ncbi:NF-kappa-B inhibitor epsilon-like isoform X2 [Dysidea avara]|uniref:NF-kappa-B inhibitor epsilon-like isoform X2 n=1 Tax=Dysidea avara TaxID=196820 RepID=UPI0033280FB7
MDTVVFSIYKGPIRTSVIVAASNSPKQEIIEVLDSQEGPSTTSTTLPQLLARSGPSPAATAVAAAIVTKQLNQPQPLRAGEVEQQSNPAAKNSEQIIQLDKQSWEQLPPLYKYMIQMRVIEEQQQLQLAARQMQGQQPLPPNLLQGLALQSQMLNMFQAQLANQNFLQQMGGGKIPLITTTAPVAGTLPVFPAIATTATTSGPMSQQEATVVTTASVSMATTSSLSQPRLSTPVVNSNQSHDHGQQHKAEDKESSNKMRDTTSYRSNEVPDSPVATPTDEGSKGDRSGPHDVLLRVSEAHLGTLQDEDGDTPLHLAVIQENFKLVQYLVKLITSVYMSLDIANNLRQTPLHLAVITHQPHMVSLLVQSGANVNFPDRHGSSSVHLAAQRRDLKCLQALAMATNPLPDFNLRNFDGLTPVHIATKEACIDVLRFLFQMGANKNALDATSGRTALHYAVELENFMLVNYLMEAGVDANATTFAGNTPLHIASGRKMKDIVAVLMAYGANPGIANYEGDLPSGLPPPSLVMARMKKYKKDN